MDLGIQIHLAKKWLEMDLTNFVNILGAWSRASGPLYRLLAQALRQAILEGDIPAGTRLPAERMLAEALAVSRNTVIAAYDVLQQESLIIRQHGSGTWVQALSQEQAANYRSTANGSLARSPLFEMLLHEPQDLIDLSTGVPGALDGLSLQAFTLQEDKLAALLSTPGYAPSGLPELRQAIAGYFVQMGLPTRPEQILVTSGAQQALSLAALLYVQRGDTVLIENPTFFGALDTFRALGARLIPLPMDGEGLRVDVLQRALGTCLPRLLYLTPTFHNPTGTLLSRARRRAIASLAREFAFPIIEDNAFADLCLTDEAPPPLASFASEEAILTLGSMNKLFWQGLRVGWIRASEALITRLSRLKIIADLGTGSLTQAIALQLLDHLAEVKALRQQQLRAQLQMVTELLGAYLPDWTWHTPSGGFFLWVRLPVGDASEFAQIALRFAVVITPGTVMSVDDLHHQYLRLPFLLPPETLSKGIQRLSQAWKVYSRLEPPFNEPAQAEYTH
ncbi:PLP-dependent aminotransferase family protein [Ktedonosporobacter rubrisoli]|uniref:PLP-dependent aminotransferase family protein n=1 Tax=Ktedonosporobacter rubrisoli TaxID=2509675 RepID=A0A4P6JXE3_KTERU|nr:PLP-dependent aminotransferase family protein [Ktedonosporobacter rubrisoli]QBD80418.1 PLP-dependent aminotransferase family protein [Ktedonosporobacter rubrisoli]